MSNIIRVISAAVSQTGAVFYTEDGNERTISITDPRISKMVDQVLDAVSKGQIPVEVDMTTYSVFAQIEEESGGLMKFFRVAKKKLASLLGSRMERSPNVSSEGFHSKVKTDAKVQEIVALADENRIKVQFVDDVFLRRLHAGNHQGVVAVTAAVEYADLDTLIASVADATARAALNLA